jgi:hypothetical protein
VHKPFYGNSAIGNKSIYWNIIIGHMPIYCSGCIKFYEQFLLCH